MARWRSTGREASRPPPEPGRRRATGPPARRHIHAGHHRSPRSAQRLAQVLPGSTQRLTWPLTPSLRKHVRGETPNPTTNRDRPTRARFAPTADLCAPASQDQTWLLQADLPIRHGPESVAPNPRAAPDRAITAARRAFSPAFSITQRDVVPSAEPDADCNPCAGVAGLKAVVGRQARRCCERTARLPLA